MGLVVEHVIETEDVGRVERALLGGVCLGEVDSGLPRRTDDSTLHELMGDLIRLLNSNPKAFDPTAVRQAGNCAPCLCHDFPISAPDVQEPFFFSTSVTDLSEKKKKTRIGKGGQRRRHWPSPEDGYLKFR